MLQQHWWTLGYKQFFTCCHYPFSPVLREPLWCFWSLFFFVFSWLSFPFAKYTWFILWNGSRIEWFTFSKYQTQNFYLKMARHISSILPHFWRGALIIRKQGNCLAGVNMELDDGMAVGISPCNPFHPPDVPLEQIPVHH